METLSLWEHFILYSDSFFFFFLSVVTVTFTLFSALISFLLNPKHTVQKIIT